MEEINVTIYSGYNLLGWANLDDTNMSAVINEGNGILGVNVWPVTPPDLVAAWNASTQDWAVQIMGLPQMVDDKSFNITIGEAFFITISGLPEGTPAYWRGGRNF